MAFLTTAVHFSNFLDIASVLLCALDLAFNSASSLAARIISCRPSTSATRLVFFLISSPTFSTSPAMRSSSSKSSSSSSSSGLAHRTSIASALAVATTGAVALALGCCFCRSNSASRPMRSIS